ncbi:MAG: hypothetical protein EPN64_13270 [Burkholderiaceae bacterium]|nr:MAG: hypothetical protein EPN64_13270 [Burkholderiaceae bacterium]
MTQSESTRAEIPHTESATVKSLGNRMTAQLAFKIALLFVGFPFLFVMAMVKVVFFHGKGDAKPVEKAPTALVGSTFESKPDQTKPAIAIEPTVTAPTLSGALPLFEAASCHHVVQIDDAVVNFGHYVNGSSPRISRLVKVKTERLPWQRARIAFRRYKLPDFTPAMAEAVRLPYTLAGAVTLTKTDLKAKPAKASDAHDEIKPRATALDFDSDATDDLKQTARPMVATGIVTSAGTVKVTRAGGKPYSAFQIVVVDGPSRAIFTGVDLLEKFNNNVFGIHDRIHIEKIREEFEIEDRGRKMKRQKNAYKIEVLERAPN